MPFELSQNDQLRHIVVRTDLFSREPSTLYTALVRPSVLLQRLKHVRIYTKFVVRRLVIAHLVVTARHFHLFS